MGTCGLIYIRTDANSTIATGHMMRCLSVARACLLKGMQVCFVVSDEESKSVFDALATDAFSSENSSENLPSLSVNVLQTAVYNDLEKELPELTDMIVTNKPGILLLDSYFVTPAYLEAVNRVTKTAYIDDLRSFDYEVDLLINYDIIPENAIAEYKASYQNATSCLLGGLYTPLRSQFQNCGFTVRDFVSENVNTSADYGNHPNTSVMQKPNVLITTGGSDPYHFCLHFLEAAKHLPVTFHVVVGRLNTDKEALLSYEKLGNVILHENVTDMASLMTGCDFAVSAAGTTLYELCALGVPSVSYTMADNQMVTANAFDAADAISYAGDIRPASDYSLRISELNHRPEINDEVISRIVAYIKEMTLSSHNFTKRKSAHESMRRLVDTNGASRIAEALISCME